MTATMRGGAVLGLLLLGACAARPPAPAVVDTGPPPGIDGRYRGTVRLVSSQDRSCPRSGPRVLDVVNGTVSVSYSGSRRTARSTPARMPLEATVGSDGKFHTSDGTGTLDGTLRDGTLIFTISSPVCEHYWNLHQVS